MVDRDDAPLGLDAPEKVGDFRQPGRTQFEREWPGRPDHVRMAKEGGDLPSRQDQKSVVLGLKTSEFGKGRRRVVFGDGNEIQTGGAGALQRAKGRAWNASARPAVA